MEPWFQYTHFLVALLVIVDPFFAAPLFLTFSAGYETPQRNRMAVLISLTVFAVLVLAALTGESVLLVLGTGLPAFRVGGGLVLLFTAFAMLNVHFGALPEAESNPPGREDDATSGVVPLGIPLLAGPGAIGTVIIASSRTPGWRHRLMIVLCIAVVSGVIWLTLRLASTIGAYLGTLGLKVANRVLGLLLSAIAIEFIARGLRQLFPVLGRGG